MESKLNVQLLAHTPDPEKTIATAARLCYSKADITKLQKKMTEDKINSFIEMLRNLGHESPFEHASFTFGVEGISRSLTHQLVRHRVASYSQQSQRYVEAKNFSYIIPPTIKKDKKSLEKYNVLMDSINKAYTELLEIAPKEDARYILPNATETKIIITMNARELFHYFKLRCCNRAQWEIRYMSIEMLQILKKRFPEIFKNCGPSCVNGPCSEGKMSCKKAAQVRKFFK